jgi:cytochrome oxidase Cu insertion factor (SCO1/SenC/PrrC family)
VLRASLLYLPAVFGLMMIAGCKTSSQQPKPEPPDLDFPVGSFKLTERSGKQVTEADLKGKVWIASFIFTRCSGPCPHVSATMAKLQAEMPNPKDMLFVTFTVDPEYDTPEQLQEYAKNFRADPDRWLFLTGNEKEMHDLLAKQFKQAVEKSPKGAKPGEEFTHSSRLAVVDRKGVIRAVFDGVPSDKQPNSKQQFEENLGRLKSKLSKLLEE